MPAVGVIVGITRPVLLELVVWILVVTRSAMAVDELFIPPLEPVGDGEASISGTKLP